MKEMILKRKGIRRVLSLVLCLAMCISLMPSTVFAAGMHTHEGTIVTEGTLSPYYICSCGQCYKDEACTFNITGWLDEYKNTIYDVQISIEEPVLGGAPTVAVVGESSLYTCEGVWSRMPDGYPEYTGKFEPGTYYYCFNVKPVNPAHKISASSVYFNGENLQKYTGTYPFHVAFEIKHICTGTLVTADTLRPYYSCECGKYYEDEACTKEIEEADLENWRTLIDDVQISIEKPVLGGTPTVAVVGDSSLYSCEGVWSLMRDGRPEFTGTFEPGTYYYCFDVKPVNPAHKISASSVYLNGEKLEKYTGTYPYRMEFEVKHICTGTLVTADTLRPYYSCECGKYYEDEACTKEIAEADLVNWRTRIDDIQISIEEPVLGGAPTVAVVGESSLYTCEGVWSRMPDGYPEYTGKFEPGTYYYCFNVKPMNPAHKINAYDVYLNGENLDIYTGTYPYRVKFTIEHTCTGTLVTADTLRPYYSCECGKNYEDEACTKEIAEADLVNWRTRIDDIQISIEEPVLGGAPTVAVVGESSLYTCEGVWSRMPDGYPEYTGKFEPGTYYYCFNVKPVNPAHKINAYDVYLNGENLDIYTGTYPYRVKFTIEHTCTGTIVTADTLRPYYSCECGKYYEDEACTKEIAEVDLENWRTLIDDVRITIAVPVPGEKPTAAVVGDSSLYTCVGVWSTFADGTGAVEDIFSSNTDYYYCFDVQPVNPKNTISSTGVYLNGENLEKYTGTYPYRVKFNSGNCKHTNITPVEKVDATCKHTGKKAYVKCNGCNQYFEDAACKNSISDIANWGIISKTDTHVLPDTWNTSTDVHWGYCKVCGESISETHDLITKEIENTKPSFDEDGVIQTETACSKCSYSTSHTEILPAEKYIRESQATMTPAAITKVMCGNDLTFESADASKYTVKLGRILDLTDSSLNTGGSGYPTDKKFVAGHEYAIEIHFYAVAPYEYDEMRSTHSSTFMINGNITDISAAVVLSGSTYRRIVFAADDVEHVHEGGTATCTNKAVCDICGEEYGDVNSSNHDFSKYISNGDGTHKVVCANCDENQEGHEADACVAGADGKCTKCGAIMDGWQKIDGKWKFFKVGVAQTGWLKDAGKWYYFDANGNMKTGWVKDGGKWYYMASSGAMSTGWKQISGKWYYFGTSGVMVTGWQKISNKWYYFDDGAMVTGWKKLSNKWYYFDDGAMVSGWKKLDGKWYYFDDGAMVTGWKKLDSKWYYFGTNGVMVSNKTITIDGKKYTFNASGVWVK